jgi:hypothetical protein
MIQVNSKSLQMTSSSPFTTTSDVLRHLNESLQRMQQQQQQQQQQQHDDDDNKNNDRSSRVNNNGKFELQMRLPDGSARPANTEETASADFQNKLQQAAAYVASLPTRSEKLDWCEQQRMYGNSILKNDHRAAMDVYLTCLTVAADTTLDNNDVYDVDDHGHDKSKYNPRQRRLLLFAKVLNNLAVCTMEMSWYQKTVQFCTMGLDHLSGKDNNSNLQDDPELQIQKCKLYFKRAKASRLRGEYKSAKIDLAHSRQQCLLCDDRDDDDIHASLVQFATTMDKEEQLLNQAVKRAKRNLDVQKRAMRQVLGNHNPDTTTPFLNTENDIANPTATIMTKPLYDDLDSKDAAVADQQRKFSTLRAPDDDDDDKRENDHHAVLVPPTYLQMYLQKVARQAQRLLDWLDEQADTKID